MAPAYLVDPASEQQALKLPVSIAGARSSGANLMLYPAGCFIFLVAPLLISTIGLLVSLLGNR